MQECNGVKSGAPINTPPQLELFLLKLTTTLTVAELKIPHQTNAMYSPYDAGTPCRTD